MEFDIGIQGGANYDFSIAGIRRGGNNLSLLTCVEKPNVRILGGYLKRLAAGDGIDVEVTETEIQFSDLVLQDYAAEPSTIDSDTPARSLSRRLLGVSGSASRILFREMCIHAPPITLLRLARFSWDLSFRPGVGPGGHGL
jgi:hypothetical protein